MKFRALIRYCKLANEEHRRSARQYAHTFHFPMAICVADAFNDLPPVYRLGILLHECGHLYAGRDSSERIADVAIRQIYGIRILRRTYKGQRQLECVELKDCSKARRVLGEVIE